MIKAILFDLDNTLLYTPDSRFAISFAGRIEQFMKTQLHLENFGKLFHKSFLSLDNKVSLEPTNAAFMMQQLSEETGIANTILEEALAQFYKSVYPELSGCIHPIPVAAKLIRHLRQQGIAIIIATNPIYPEAAIRQRMQWGQLPDEPDTYALITGSEVMHFPKHDPAYYAEILARVGLEPDEALTVGDRLDHDIIPSTTLGINTFHITSDLKQNKQTPHPSGTLEELALLLEDNLWLDSLTRQPFRPQMIVPQYRGNIGALFGMMAEVKPQHWQQHPDPDEWSILQILCHLLESERETQRSRLERILHEENPFLVDPKPPGPDIPVCDSDGFRIARQFVQERMKTITFLNTLAPIDWQRSARHNIFGLTTLIEMAHFTAQHDRLHLNQFCQTLGNCED